MRAMVLDAPGRALVERELPVPVPGPSEVLIRVSACGVCRTDLHVLDGELTEPKLPLVPGHEIVGEVVRVGSAATRHESGERVGVPWLGGTDGTCRFCRKGRENLCEHPTFTGYTHDGGYAEYCTADERYTFPVPDGLDDDPHVAPLLCAGLIGYRTYRMAGDGIERLGIYGFGAAAHIVAQIARHEDVEIYAFTSPGDTDAQGFARSLGAVWAGGSDELPPDLLDAALIFAPVGALIPTALRAIDKGGVVVAGGIHMSDIPSFPYADLWEERVIRSVANLTRADGEQLLALAPTIPIRTEVEVFDLESANEALEHLRSGSLRGAAVLVPDTG
ncbi:MAG: zinc-dependent alcohol dehydrogenase family protein [Acidimicrobiia bacterium]|nr:zinc-dependent alcohol dehydrogenase family protein [Acidimicrobiia bacterium]